jgi:hypothetical protein
MRRHHTYLPDSAKGFCPRIPLIGLVPPMVGVQGTVFSTSFDENAGFEEELSYNVQRPASWTELYLCLRLALTWRSALR